MSTANKYAGSIVKVQLSIVTTEQERQVLIYSEPILFHPFPRRLGECYEIYYEGDADDDIVEWMGDSLKRYAYADLTDDGKVRIISVAPDQEW